MFCGFFCLLPFVTVCHLVLLFILKEISDDNRLMGDWFSVSYKSQEAWTGPPHIWSDCPEQSCGSQPIQTTPPPATPYSKQPNNNATRWRWQPNKSKTHWQKQVTEVGMWGERLLISAWRDLRCATLWTRWEGEGRPSIESNLFNSWRNLDVHRYERPPVSIIQVLNYLKRCSICTQLNLLSVCY